MAERRFSARLYFLHFTVFSAIFQWQLCHYLCHLCHFLMSGVRATRHADDCSSRLNECYPLAVKPFTLRHLGDDELTIHVDNAVRIVSTAGEPYATISANVPGAHLSGDEFIFKTYGENEGVFEQLVALGIIEPTGRAVSVGRAGPQLVCRLKA